MSAGDIVFYISVILAAIGVAKVASFLDKYI